MSISRRALIAATAMVAISGFAPLAGADAQSGPVLLTVTGAVENPNRSGYNPETDKFFGYNEVDFEKATEFDFGALAALSMAKVKADFPKGGAVYEYEGPLLADVLKAAGAMGKNVTVQALDGYAVEVPMSDMIANGAIVALKRDGKAFGIGDFGPTQIVYPRAERADLSEMSDDTWVWSIFHIKVE